jgi:hypothetical protein
MTQILLRVSHPHLELKTENGVRQFDGDWVCEFLSEALPNIEVVSGQEIVSPHFVDNPGLESDLAFLANHYRKNHAGRE